MKRSTSRSSLSSCSRSWSFLSRKVPSTWSGSKTCSMKLHKKEPQALVFFNSSNTSWESSWPWKKKSRILSFRSDWSSERSKITYCTIMASKRFFIRRISRWCSFLMNDRTQSNFMTRTWQMSTNSIQRKKNIIIDTLRSLTSTTPK